MTKEVDNALLLRLNDHFATQIGLHLPNNRLSDFKRNFKSAAKEFAMDPNECAEWLLNTSTLTKDQVAILAFHFTIGETYFFRDPKVWEVLEDEILWDLVRRRRAEGNRTLRLWSAGCCTGEEPYSMAMVLKRLIHDIDSWNITVFGTDLNPSFLKKAKSGTYSDWSFRVTSPGIKDKFFHSHGAGKFEVIDDVKGMVEFHQINLVSEDRYITSIIQPGSIDVLFCRNVLMYFHPDQVDKVLLKLESSLTPDGILAVNPIELLCIPEKMFERLKHPGAAMLRKRKAWAPLETPGFDTSYSSYKPQAPSTLGMDLDFSVTGSTFFTTLPANLPPVENRPDVHVTAAREEVSVPETGESDSTVEAQRFFDEGKYRECVAHLLKVSANRNAEPARARLLAHAYSNEGDYGGALAMTDKAIDNDKLNHTLYYVRATIQQALGNIPEAVSSLRQALFLEPEFVVAEFYLASLLYQSGKNTEAAKRFRSALMVLKQYNENEILPEGEGITAGRLAEIVEALLTEAAI
jgi:chemotaxis protein methyltransferase CheR